MTTFQYCDKIDIPLKGFIFLCKKLGSNIPRGKTHPIRKVFKTFERVLLFEGGKHSPTIQEVPKMRVKITLACTECKQRNYNTMKNKKNDPDRLEMNKYCRFCKKHTLHKETK